MTQNISRDIISSQCSILSFFTAEAKSVSSLSSTATMNPFGADLLNDILNGTIAGTLETAR